MKNAGTIDYLSLGKLHFFSPFPLIFCSLIIAWHMDKWNWESGEATDPKVKNPKILPLNYADTKYGKGKGKALPEVDITDVRVLEPEEDPHYSTS